MVRIRLRRVGRKKAPAYRIVVEAVTNVQRHSGADRCVVRLAREDGELRIDVSDTGSGLAPDRRPGVGLSSMRERAEELGGSLEITASPTGGTVVDALLPHAVAVRHG